MAKKSKQNNDYGKVTNWKKALARLDEGKRSIQGR